MRPSLPGTPSQQSEKYKSLCEAFSKDLGRDGATSVRHLNLLGLFVKAVHTLIGHHQAVKFQENSIRKRSA